MKNPAIVMIAAMIWLAFAWQDAAQAFNPDANGQVVKTAVQPNGSILITGNFTTVGGLDRPRFARLNSDGSVDTDTHVPTVVNYGWGLAVQADGKALIAGAGTQGNGGLLRMNLDGSVDDTFIDAFTGGSPTIYAIVPQADGKILVGGRFSTVGGQPRTNLARLNADGSLDTGFDPGDLASDPVNTIAVQADGRIIVGGGMLKRFLPDGAADSAEPLAMPQQGTYINAVWSLADGKTLVGGNDALTFADGINRGSVVRLNADGSVDTDFSPAVDYQIMDLFVDPAGKIIIGGSFNTVGGQPRKGLTRLNADGTLDTDFAEPSVSVLGLTLQADGKIVIGGNFFEVNGLERNSIARLHSDGRLDNGAPGPLTVTPRASANGSISPAMPQSLDEGGRVAFTLSPDPGHAVASVSGCDGVRTGDVYLTGWVWADCEVVVGFVPEDQAIFDPAPNGNIEDFEVSSDGSILVAGWFTRIGGLEKLKLARLDAADGSAAPDFADGTGIYQPTTSGDVGYVVAEQPDGKVLFGGQRGLLRVDTDGTIDAGFDVNFGGWETVYAIALQPDGKILIGGDFDSVNGIARSNLARLNADGTLDTGFNSEQGADGVVSTIVVEPDGRIVIGGGFSSVDGSPQRGMARLNSDGSLVTGFPAAGTAVKALHRLSNGSYLIGGANAIDLGDGSTPDSQLIRMLPDGTRDPTFEGFVDGLGMENMHVQSDGAIIISGRVLIINGEQRLWLARLTDDGALDSGFTPSLDSGPRAIETQPDGKILIGGRFTHVDGFPRRGMARLKPDGRIDIDAFVVTALAGANGFISPDTPQEVLPGEQTQFTVVPDSGYVIGAVNGCDGSLDGLTYTTGLIVSHCTITADFLLDNVNYTVTPAVGAHGSIAPSTPQSVPFAQTANFQLIPDSGYYVAGAEGCGGNLNNDTYTTERILADCSVIARFHRPAALVAAGGASQSTAVNTGFASPLTVRVTDEDGLPVAGVEVNFSAPATSASAVLSAATAVTDENGEASVAAQANDTAGSYEVTADAHGIDVAFPLSNEAPGQGGIELRVTLSTDPPPACGTATSIQAAPGQPVNYCFTVINRSEVTLNYHTLTMLTYNPFQYEFNAWDRLFNQMEQPIPPGGTFSYNRLITAGTEDQAPQFTWNATATVPDYEESSDESVNFTDISATGTPLELTTYGVHRLGSLPFPINFYGQHFHEGDRSFMCINNSGTLYIRTGDEPDGCPMMYITAPDFVGDNREMIAVANTHYYVNGLAAHWDLLGEHGTVYYGTVGEAPNRRFVIQWQDKDHGNYPNPADGITFQTVIEEGTGRIHYVYEDLGFGVSTSPNEPHPDQGGSATVGLVGFTANHPTPPYRQHSFDEPVLTEGQVITWTPTDVLRHASASAVVEVGAPHVFLEPASIRASAGAGGHAQSVFAIGNSGEIDLDWSLHEAAPQGHFPPFDMLAWLSSWEVLDSTTDRHAAVPMIDAAPAGSTEVFSVPAYANGSGRPVSFDASNPMRFVHGVGVPSRSLLWAADIAGDDFTQVYLFGGGPAIGGTEDRGFLRADIATGEFTYIGEAQLDSIYHRWNSLAWDAQTHTMFAASASLSEYVIRGCESTVVSDLYAIDLETAATVRIGEIDAGTDVCIRGLAVAPDGTLYGVDDYSNALVAIDKRTGDAAVIGSLGFNIRGAISADFDDSTGVLYLTNNNAIYTVDRVTGMATLVGPIPSINGQITRVDGLSIAVAGGQCADPAQVPWLSVQQTAGITPPDSQAQVTVDLDAGDLAPGHYEANLCVFSNDRGKSLVRVPVSFTVAGGEGDAIFSDGFELEMESAVTPGDSNSR